jgi:hypothetical protein
MSNLGKISNQLGGNLGAGGGIGSQCLTENQKAIRETPEPSMFRDEQSTEFWNAHEASARRGQARSTGMANGSRRATGGNSDVGGR